MSLGVLHNTLPDITDGGALTQIVVTDRPEDDVTCTNPAP